MSDTPLADFTTRLEAWGLLYGLYTQGSQTPLKSSLKSNNQPTHTSFAPPGATHESNIRKGGQTQGPPIRLEEWDLHP
jgi:hypothetical protein